MSLPRIGITLGDPGGIGPEIVLKVLQASDRLPDAAYVIFGSRVFLERELSLLGLKNLDIPSFSTPPPPISLMNIPGPRSEIPKGSPSRQGGDVSFRFFEAAVLAARKHQIHAVVTAPISKQSWAMAGLDWKGHTEYLSRFYPDAIMSFWADRLKTVLFSHHVPLKDAVNLIQKKALLDFFLNLNRQLSRLSSRRYHFLVSGLNPHSGEGGILGAEEIEEIRPAVEDARKAGMSIDGPYPPDIVFRLALGSKDKIVIALYHDQGLIPFKLEAFETGVNATLGLPFIRTSPDHGTAFDLAGKGQADPRSLMEAIRLAADLFDAL